MIKNINNTYKNVTVKLDLNEFIDCTFENCTMEYEGKGQISMIGCSFKNVNWIFSGAAQNTLQFMHSIYHGMGDGGKEIIEKTFENIKKK